MTLTGASRSPDPLSSGAELLRRQWLEPTLELNGLTGGYGGPGTKTVIPGRSGAKISCRLAAGQDPDRVFDSIRRHLEQHCPAGFGLEVERHGRGSAAATLPPDLPALGVIEDVLDGLYGVRPLRVAMGATIPIGDIFRRVLSIETVFFSFSTADEDFHGPNEFFRLQSFRDGTAGPSSSASPPSSRSSAPASKVMSWSRSQSLAASWITVPRPCPYR